MRLTIVDVFAEAPLAGNQLAVIQDAQHLSSERMQAIAREMNFSETTFVRAESEKEANVRIFTPASELPFAGHPTIGTAWVLGRNQAEFVLNLGVGPVAVSFDPTGICWMSPPMPEFTGTLGTADAARLLGLAEADLHPDFAATFLSIGPKFLLVGVADESVLERALLNPAVRDELIAAGLPADSAFVFCPAAETNYAARMFFDVQGIREDPATGSANSGFAVYLRDRCGVSPGKYVVAQGDHMLRPSRIYLELEQNTYRVGGRVQSVVTGELGLGG